MKQLEKLLSRIRRAAERYGMIEDGDKIAVGLSGGKDSLALLAALAAMRRFYPASYELCALSVDPGYPGGEGMFRPLTEFCGKLGVAHRIVETQIYAVVFEGRREKNPCSLCANMRRGALADEAVSMGANKLALGHNLDDAAETVLMNLTAGGRIGCFSPVTVYEDRGLSVIRPLIYARAGEIVACANAEALPVIPSPCPAAGHTERAAMRALIRQLDRENRGVRERIVGALERSGIDGWHL